MASKIDSYLTSHEQTNLAVNTFLSLEMDETEDTSDEFFAFVGDNICSRTAIPTSTPC